jgi:HEAT repeat protein
VGRSEWRDGDPAAREKANSLETLGRLLKDPAGAVRVAAAEALGEFAPDPRAASALLSATGDADVTVRLAAARTLLKFNEPDRRSAIRILLALLADPGPVPDRNAVLDVLKGVDDEAQDQAVRALAGLLASPALGRVRRVPLGPTDDAIATLASDESVVCPDVIDCLRSLGPRASPALPALDALLKDDDPILRAGAARAIVAILGKDNPDSVPVLVGIVIDPMVPHPWRMNALDALRQMGPGALANATPGLIRLLGDANPAVRLTALSMLQEILGSIPAEMPKPGEGK